MGSITNSLVLGVFAILVGPKVWLHWQKLPVYGESPKWDLDILDKVACTVAVIWMSIYRVPNKYPLTTQG